MINACSCHMQRRGKQLLCCRAALPSDPCLRTPGQAAVAGAATAGDEHSGIIGDEEEEARREDLRIVNKFVRCCLRCWRRRRYIGCFILSTSNATIIDQ